MFERPVLTAFVTVTVCEESTRLAPPSTAIPNPSVAFLNPNAPNPASAKNAKVSLAQLNIARDISMQVQNTEGEDKGKELPSTDEGGSSDEYRCRIVEELSSPTNE